MLGKQYKHMKHCTQTDHSAIDDKRITSQRMQLSGARHGHAATKNAASHLSGGHQLCQVPGALGVGTAAEHNAL